MSCPAFAPFVFLIHNCLPFSHLRLSCTIGSLLPFALLRCHTHSCFILFVLNMHMRLRVLVRARSTCLWKHLHAAHACGRSFMRARRTVLARGGSCVYWVRARMRTRS